jgi:hypothetical protein
LQDLSPKMTAMAREFKACVRTKKSTPQHLLHVVFLYCGLDKSLWDTAADFTLLYEMRPPNTVATLPAPGRLLVIDGSHVQGPGAQGI